MKKTCRIYNEPALRLRSGHRKRRVKAKLGEDRQEAVGPNDVWALGECLHSPVAWRAMDFAHDQIAPGKKLRIPTIVDARSHLRPAADPRFVGAGRRATHVALWPVTHPIDEQATTREDLINLKRGLACGG